MGFDLNYGAAIEAELFQLSALIERHPLQEGEIPARWLSLKLLEGDDVIVRSLLDPDHIEDILRAAGQARQRLGGAAPEGVEIAIADRRYEIASRIVSESLVKEARASANLAERLDRWLIHPRVGWLFFLAVMYLLFRLVIDVSAPFVDWVDAVITGPVAFGVGVLLNWIGAGAWLQSLILEGVVAGVGGVLVFLPGLIVLFAFIGILEDSGYMARAAFVTHRLLQSLGLNGKSFIPLLLGFGCGVPAIYATRTLERRRDRLLTSLLVPLMSCSARLPVYVVFGMAFFGDRADVVIWGLYALGALVALGVGVLFSRTIMCSTEAADFVMELPAFRWPSLRNLRVQVAHRTREFLRNAGTVILAASLVIWFLLNLPFGVTSMSESLFGKVSRAVAPLLEPAGFGSWEAAGSLMTGLVAKEVVVSSMSQIYLGEQAGALDLGGSSLADELRQAGAGLIAALKQSGRALLETLTPGLRVFGADGVEEDTQLSAHLQTSFSTLSALSFLVFVLLYVPCVATLGAIRSEFGVRWACFSGLYQTGLAWALATLVFQLGSLLGWA